jgi:hypothetical protein
LLHSFVFPIPVTILWRSSFPLFEPIHICTGSTLKSIYT